MSRRVHLVIDDELLAQVDAARGAGQSRGDFVRRALEEALGTNGKKPEVAEAEGQPPKTGSLTRSAPVPPRASYVKPFNPRPKGKS